MSQDPSPSSPRLPASQASSSSWTDAAVEQLKALWSQPDLTAAVIARRLGISRNAVLGKVHRLALPTRRVGPRLLRLPPPPRPAPKPRTKPEPAPRAAARVKPTPAQPPVLPGLVAHLEDLAFHACHWPVGDPRDRAFAFCGRPAGARVYCPTHWRLGHVQRSEAG